MERIEIEELKRNLLGMMILNTIQQDKDSHGKTCDCLPCMKAKEVHVAWCACSNCNTKRRALGIAEVEF